MRLYLSRFVCLDTKSNLDRCEAEAAKAAAAGADVVVFPESFLHGYTRSLDPAAARERFSRVSAGAPEALFVFGTISEAGRNRLTVWRGGRCQTTYDKVHLFAPNDEDALWQEGDRYVAVRFAGWTLGFLTCNDVRFPEQARALRLKARCDLLLVPAWWPWRRDDVFAALLRARAIENAVFVAGCCIAASETPEEPFAGAGNHVFDPLGAPVPTQDDHSYALDRGRAADVLVDPLTRHRDIGTVEVHDA